MYLCKCANVDVTCCICAYMICDIIGPDAMAGRTGQICPKMQPSSHEACIKGGVSTTKITTTSVACRLPHEPQESRTATPYICQSPAGPAGRKEP